MAVIPTHPQTVKRYLVRARSDVSLETYSWTLRSHGTVGRMTVIDAHVYWEVDSQLYAEQLDRLLNDAGLRVDVICPPELG